VELRVRGVQVDGGRVLVAELGSGPPLVLIHGLAGTYRYWLPSARRLAAHYRVLIPDVPGFGGSDAAEHPFSLLAAGQRLLAACEARGAARHVLVGHSLGGPIAVLVAGHAPARASGVVLASTTGLSSERAWRRHVLLPIMRRALRSERTWENLLAAHPSLRGIVFSQMLTRPRELDAITTRMLVGGAALARQLGDSLQASLDCDVRDTVRDLPLPLGVVWGEYDKTVSIEDAALALRLRPDARGQVIRDAGHVPMVEEPDAFAAALVEVLPDGWREPSTRVGSER
jgi:abhydrolase domain-containing protein 6